jgi:hypothetical protein
MLIEPIMVNGKPTPQKTKVGEFTRSVPAMKDPQD